MIKRVSIHAPRAGRDMLILLPSAPCARFNPRAPCGARRLCFASHSSTSCFNPRAPCGARRRAVAVRKRRARVSIHAPRAGRDFVGTAARPPVLSFNPRAPCGARQQKKLRLPSFATYLWVLLATNMIFSMSEQRTLLSCAAST